MKQESSLQNMLETERNNIIERNQALNCQQKKFKPLSVKEFLSLEFFSIVPILNLIPLITIISKKDSNVNKKTFAKSILLWYAIAAIFAILYTAVYILSGSDLFCIFKTSPT